MFIRMFWERCPEFVVEEEDAFFIEATPDEAKEKILPELSPHEKLKFEQMKDAYLARQTMGGAREGRYYFLVSCDAHAIKFESVQFMTSDLSTRGGRPRAVPDIPLASIDELASIDVSTL